MRVILLYQCDTDLIVLVDIASPFSGISINKKVSIHTKLLYLFILNTTTQQHTLLVWMERNIVERRTSQEIDSVLYCNYIQRKSATSLLTHVDMSYFSISFIIHFVTLCNVFVRSFKNMPALSQVLVTASSTEASLHGKSYSENIK